jgi:hypothetical protein
MLLLEDGRTFKRWGLMEGSEVTGGVPLKEIVGLPSHTSIPGHEVFLLWNVLSP